MLAKYHEQLFNLEQGNNTFREVYKLRSEEKYEDAIKSTINGYRTAYNAYTNLYEKKF